MPLLKDSQEYLAASCWWCHRIRLYNMNNGQISTAFNDKQYRPGFICPGENGEIFTIGDVSGSMQIYRINCRESLFHISYIINTNLSKYYGICYVPITNCIAVSNWRESLVSAVCCNTGETLWEMKGEVEGVECCPCGMVYSPEHQALLVADGPNCQVIVLGPKDGSVKQVIVLNKDMGGIVEVCLHKNKLVVLHCKANDKFKISTFVI